MRQDIECIARLAGEKIMESYPIPDSQIQEKGDGSPVTAADLAANKIITEGLQKVSNYPIVSEEDFESENYPPEGDCFWLVDPLDGTKDFIHSTGHFTVNIALIKGGHSIAGVVYVPVSKDMFSAFEGKAYKNGHEIKTTNSHGVTIGAISHFHKGGDTDKFLQRNGITESKAYGSSLKFCMLAEGVIDIYPRLGPTSQWDTAAGQAVAEAAGCLVVRLEDRERLVYGKHPIRNPHFVAVKPDLSWV